MRRVNINDMIQRANPRRRKSIIKGTDTQPVSIPSSNSPNASKTASQLLSTQIVLIAMYFKAAILSAIALLFAGQAMGEALIATDSGTGVFTVIPSLQGNTQYSFFSVVADEKLTRACIAQS